MPPRSQRRARLTDPHVLTAAVSRPRTQYRRAKASRRTFCWMTVPRC